MMKKVHLIYSLIQFSFFYCYSQSTINKVYYDGGGARANTVIQTSDSAFIIAGTIKTALVMDVIKVNFNGDTLWSFVYDLGHGGGDIIYTSIETSDGNYIIGGMTADTSVMNSDAFLIKLKPNGDTVWVRKIGLPNNSERCYSVKQTSDGGFIFCGIRFNTSGSDCDVYLVKTDINGFPQWEKTLGGTGWDYGNSIELTSEGGYLILGSTYSYGIGTYNMYLIKTDSLGNMIWQKTYGGNLKDYGNSITLSNDGSYILSGGIQTNTNDFHGYVLKTDTSGVVLWQKQYGVGFDYDEFTSVKELTNGNIVLSGNYEENIGIRVHPLGWLMKLNPSGDSIWSKKYSHFFNDSTDHYFYAMDLTNDGGFVMAGMTIDLRYGANPTNGMWLVKTDSYGCDSTACLTVSIKENDFLKKSKLLAYPNPFSETTTVEYVIPEGTQSSTLYLCDVFGNQIKKYPIIATGTGKLTIDGSVLNSGVYSCRLVSDKKIISICKLIIIK